MANQTTRVKYPHTSQRVLEYLRANANIDIPSIELQKALSLPATPVANAIVHLRANGIRIEKPINGVYRYCSGPHEEEKPEMPTQKLYEFVGTSKGITIVRGEDDELYRVIPLFDFEPTPSR